MESLLSGYRDPLFGLIVFFGLIFIIAFFSYWWAVYRSKEQEEHIEHFFHKFEENVDRELERIIEDKDSKKALLLLAQSYQRSGDYEKAITLYLKLKEEVGFEERMDLLKKLADLYFKAGFLARSAQIYEEILGYFPRRKDVLHQLLVVYEKLQDIQKAKDVAKSLEELGESCDMDYLLAKECAKNEDVAGLVSIYRKNPDLVRMIFERLFMLDAKRAWDILKEEDIPKIIDILWYLPKEKIDLRYKILQEIYGAKGYITHIQKSDIFELDLLLHYPKADLDFEYLCKRCRQIYPVSFTRCPNCFTVQSPQIQMLITPKREVYEKDITF